MIGSGDSGRGHWRREVRDGYVKHVGVFEVVAIDGEVLGSVEGVVIERPHAAAEVLIHNPPDDLLRHRHGPCLVLWRPGTNWFKLHWSRPAQDFETALGYTEGLLAEAAIEAWIRDQMHDSPNDSIPPPQLGLDPEQDFAPTTRVRTLVWLAGVLAGLAVVFEVFARGS